ncbi:ABC transporter substrate-binding protein [Shimia sp. R11_0]|uniref:ABC transporter substrate-binding protein n=1 Tax=Shimia sp. R11_0 TaxID=2821096 RepID=UPI001ADB178F|nr:ABC transporter substrate-binding protein [Shimia sp. R11_0]MBO9476057.1 ABC transporter substrate-binding protein [Shimia sp. R11_0]
MLKRTSFLSLLPVMFCMALPAGADSFPVTVTDDRGEQVSFEHQPERVVALWTPAADLMVALGRPVTGVTTYEAKMPVYLGDALDGVMDLGDITAPNLEMLASSDIDLTIGMTSYNAPYAEQIEHFSRFLTFDSYRLEDALKSVLTLGTALGAQAETQKLDEAFSALMQEYGARAPKEGREVMVIWSFQDTLYGYQDGLTATDIIGALGTVNPLGMLADRESPDTGFIVLETEDLLAHDPDAILMFISHGGTPKYSPAYERLKAYKNGQFYSVGYQYSQPSGPIARELVLREAAHLIYPEVFDAPDMPEVARAVPVTFEGQ